MSFSIRYSGCDKVFWKGSLPCRKTNSRVLEGFQGRRSQSCDAAVINVTLWSSSRTIGEVRGMRDEKV